MKTNPSSLAGRSPNAPTTSTISLLPQRATALAWVIRRPAAATRIEIPTELPADELGRGPQGAPTDRRLHRAQDRAESGATEERRAADQEIRRNGETPRPGFGGGLEAEESENQKSMPQKGSRHATAR
jgi:hypothetical protein